nr:hypothetical protein [Gemmatimonadales bacterium]
LAVLPFENQGAASDDYFADGLTEEIRGKLTALPGLQVTASTSSGQYRKSTKSLRDIAAELGVDYLLVGKVRWEKRADGTSRVRVSPELILVSSGASKWQEPFDAAITDVFAVQSEIAGLVAAKLDVALTDSVKTRLEAQPTKNVAAYDAYLRGRAITGSEPASLRAALAAYEQAVALDPTFALAWGVLGATNASLYLSGVPSPELGRTVRRAADRAIALDPAAPVGYIALAQYFRIVDVQPDSAAAAIETALRLDPTSPRALTVRSVSEGMKGQWDAALTHAQAAAALDPRSAGRWASVAGLLTRLGRYGEARAAGERMIQLAPSLQQVQVRATIELMAGDLAAARGVLKRSTLNPVALAAYMSTYNDLYWVLPEADQDVVLRLRPSSFDDDPATWATVLAQIYALRNDAARARIYADSARMAYVDQLKATPNDAQLHVLYGFSLALLGRKGEAIAEGERGVALKPPSIDAVNGAYLTHQLVRIYLLAGEKEKALDGIESLLKLRYFLSPGYLRIDPGFASLRGNPRFDRIIAAKS